VLESSLPNTLETPQTEPDDCFVDCLIRPIKPEDTHFLWEMLYQAIYVAEGLTPLPRDVLLQPEIRKYLQDWGQPHDSGFVALDSVTSNRIGAVWLRLLTGDQKGYGYVDDATPELTMAVVPECRGHGVGTQLLSHLLRAAESRYPSLSLSVSPDNPALRLYSRLGFEMVGSCGTSLVMKRGSQLPRLERLE
jgi:ribosomal protein S18 acetylase RimI-like enzyme